MFTTNFSQITRSRTFCPFSTVWRRLSSGRRLHRLLWLLLDADTDCISPSCVCWDVGNCVDINVSSQEESGGLLSFLSYTTHRSNCRAACPNFGWKMRAVCTKVPLLPTFVGGKIFPQGYFTDFLSERNNIDRIRGLANRNLFPEFRELWSGGPTIAYGDIQSFTDALVCVVFWQFSMFADSSRLISMRCPTAYDAPSDPPSQLGRGILPPHSLLLGISLSMPSVSRL